MATILEFRTVPGRTRTTTHGSGDARVCQIMIFPGVRIAYWDDVIEESDDTPPPRNATRKSSRQKRR